MSVGKQPPPSSLSTALSKCRIIVVGMTGVVSGLLLQHLTGRAPPVVPLMQRTPAMRTGGSLSGSKRSHHSPALPGVAVEKGHLGRRIAKRHLMTWTIYG